MAMPNYLIDTQQQQGGGQPRARPPGSPASAPSPRVRTGQGGVRPMARQPVPRDCPPGQNRVNGECVAAPRPPGDDEGGNRCPPGQHPSAGCTRPPREGGPPCICVADARNPAPGGAHAAGSLLTIPRELWAGFIPMLQQGIENVTSGSAYQPIAGYRGPQPWNPLGMGGMNQFYGPGSEGAFQTQGYGQSGMGPTSIYDVYASSVPIMAEERDRQIDQSLAAAGFGGTRYGTASMREAGRIGEETALRQNEMLNQLLYGQGQTDADRALQAASQSMGLGQMTEEAFRQRFQAGLPISQMEQQRADQLSMVPYEDYERNKLGFLPYLLNAVGSVGSPIQQQMQSVNNPGTPGTMEQILPWVVALGSFFSDPRTKSEVKDITPKSASKALAVLRPYSYKYKWDSKQAPRRAGFMSTDVAKVLPHAVHQDPLSGFDMVNYPEVTALIGAATLDVMDRLDRIEGKKRRSKAA